MAVILHVHLVASYDINPRFGRMQTDDGHGYYDGAGPRDKIHTGPGPAVASYTASERPALL